MARNGGNGYPPWLKSGAAIICLVAAIVFFLLGGLGIASGLDTPAWAMLVMVAFVVFGLNLPSLLNGGSGKKDGEP